MKKENVVCSRHLRRSLKVLHQSYWIECTAKTLEWNWNNKCFSFIQFFSSSLFVFVVMKNSFLWWNVNYIDFFFHLMHKKSNILTSYITKTLIHRWFCSTIDRFVFIVIVFDQLVSIFHIFLSSETIETVTRHTSHSSTKRVK